MIIRNEDGQTFGVYCGERTGKKVLVTGVYVVIKFHSDGSAPERGFFMFFYCRFTRYENIQFMQVSVVRVEVK